MNNKTSEPRREQRSETFGGGMTVRAGSWLEFAMLTGLTEREKV